MADAFPNAEGTVIVERLIATIHENRQYLSEIDGAIGDGDHGINMDKGFSMVERELAARSEAGETPGMSEALKTLGRTLVDEIGGSMGPLYGIFFKRMARASKDDEIVTTATLSAMLTAAYEGIQSVGDATVGDKTLVDTLDPAVRAVQAASEDGTPLTKAIDAMIVSAERGWRSTEDLVAKIGRASRLGERSRGVLDAGATSCYLLLKSLGETMKELAS